LTTGGTCQVPSRTEGVLSWPLHPHHEKAQETSRHPVAITGGFWARRPTAGVRYQTSVRVWPPFVPAGRAFALSLQRQTTPIILFRPQSSTKGPAPKQARVR